MLVLLNGGDPEKERSETRLQVALVDACVTEWRAVPLDDIQANA